MVLVRKGLRFCIRILVLVCFCLSRYSFFRFWRVEVIMEVDVIGIMDLKFAGVVGGYM